MLIHAIVIETIVVHWLIHGYSVLLSIILLILNIYAVILFVADIQAVRFHGIHTTPQSMYISLGLMKRMEIEWNQIDKVITNLDFQPPKKAKIEFIARDLEDVEADLILKLKTPTEATLYLGFKKHYHYVAIKSDDPKRLEQVILNKINFS